MLLRYAAPTLLDFAPESAVMFADAARIPVRFQLAGVVPAAGVTVVCELRRAGQIVARAEVVAGRGSQRTLLDVRGARLSPGEYELLARATGGTAAAVAKVRLVDSPWSGKETGP